MPIVYPPISTLLKKLVSINKKQLGSKKNIFKYFWHYVGIALLCVVGRGGGGGGVEPVVEVLRQGGLALLAEQLTATLREGGELDERLQSGPLLLRNIARLCSL